MKLPELTGDREQVHWGEQVRVRRNNSLEISMVSQGMRASEIKEAWQPLQDFVDRNPDAFTMKVNAYEVPANRLWDAAFLKEHVPEAIQRDERADQPGDRFWWAGDG